MPQSHELQTAAVWTLTVSANFAPKPKFQFGEFVPLPTKFQPQPDVIYFGRIVSMMWQRETDTWYASWEYSIELPSFHPAWEPYDLGDREHIGESDLVKLLTDYGISS